MTAKNGDILISGASTDTSYGSGRYFGYIVRLDKSGNVKWMKEYYNDRINWFDLSRLYETDNNELVAVGDIIYKGNYKLDSNYATAVVKLTEDGDITWATTFNSTLEKGMGECAQQSSVFINSISPGLNGDLIFAGTTFGCPTPMYNSTFLLDKNGNLKWDANFACDVGLQQGISAVFYKGNVLSVAKLDNIFSGGDNTIDLFFQTLDYATGKTISIQPFKADYAFPDFYYKAFGAWSAQMKVGNNGHLYVYGNMENAYSPDDIHHDMFGVVEFDNDLSYVNGYTIGTDDISTDGQTGYYSSCIDVTPAGNASIDWVKFTAQDEQQVFFASVEKGQFIKSQMVYLHHDTYGNSELFINPDGSTLYYSDYQVAERPAYKHYLTIRKNYNSDTSQSECIGADTSFAFIGDLKYIKYPQFRVNDSAFNKLYIISNSLSVIPRSISGESSCISTSLCDTIKIHGKLNYCGANPEAIFTAYKNKACGASVLWNFDTSAVSNIKYPNDTTLDIIFNTNWSGKIYAQVSGGACTLPVTDSVMVDVQATKNILYLGNDTILCPNDSLVLRAGNYSSYYWQDGSADSSFVITNPGKYYVDVIDFCDNFYSDTITVTGAKVPALNIGNDTAVCSGEKLFLNASAGFAGYSWFPLAVINGNGQNVSTTVYQNELIYAKAVTKDGCQASDSINITVKSARPVNLGNDTGFCSYDSLILDAGQNFTAYQWNTGSTTSTITVNSAGYYSVSAKDTNECISSDTIQVNIFTQPIPNLGNDKNICSGVTLNLDAGRYASYAWQDGSSSEYFAVSKPGVYWVEATDNNSCKGSDTLTIQQLLPLPSDFLVPVDSICAYDKLVLQPTGSYLNYVWSTGSTAPSITVDQPGIYSLSVTDLNECRGSDTTEVAGKECMHGVYTPTAFTPNGDGRNDLFRAKVFGKVVYFRLNIYNRFGQLLFTTTDPSKAWNGTVKGQPQNTGTYVWQCAYQLEGSVAAYEKGTVLLMH